MTRTSRTSLSCILCVGFASLAHAAPPRATSQANVPLEIKFTAQRAHPDPFNEVTLDVIFTDPEGAVLRVHDPKAMDKARALLENVTYVADMNDVSTGCDALVIATEWPVFKKLDLDRARRELTHPIIFDGRNLFDPSEMERLGFIYKSIGR